MDSFGKTAAILCVILFLAAYALRLVGVDYGYFHGDERVNEAAKVLTGQIIPGQHFYPPFFNYLNAVAFGALFVFGLMRDWWDGAAAFRAQYFTDPTVFYITARMVTAAISALMAPLFFLIARPLQLDMARATLVALLALLFPLAVFMAHIAKGDTGLATGMIACFWALLTRLQTDRRMRWDIVLGLCVALTLSFKQSAIFVLFPLAIGLFVLLARAEGMKGAALSLLRAILVIAVLWPALNIGLILDFGNFLDYQRIQAVMSVQPGQAGPLAGLPVLAARAAEVIFGLNPVMAGMTLLTPLLLLRPGCGLPQKGALWVIWLSLAIGTVATAILTGPRQPEHLWIANFAGFLLLGGLLLADLSRASQTLPRAAGRVILAAALAFSVLGTGEVLKQARAETIQQAVGTYIRDHFADRKIVTSMPLTLPQQKAAQQTELQRTTRLARKYRVELPQMAEERLIRHSAPDAIHYINMPSVMFGLESVDENDQDYEVKAHAWPLQHEEWQLVYWLSRGFGIFVVRDFDYYAHEAEPQIRRQFFQTLETACAAGPRFPPNKPLFLEREVRVFDCTAQQ